MTSSLIQLRKQAQREWTWLIGQFRQRLMPVLVTKAKSISTTNLTTQSEFAEEVFEECLLKFYELFEKGKFEKYSDLEATIVTISSYKIKEGFSKIKRDQRLYFMDAEALSTMREKHLGQLDKQEQKQLELTANIRQHLSSLPPQESDLLLRFYSGEELQDIADDLSISPAVCRKRKQRILEKLRTLILLRNGK